MGISQFVSIFAEPGSAPLLTPKGGLIWEIGPAVLFEIFIHSFGRPMFLFLLVEMMLLATTELGTDGWIQDIVGSTLKRSCERHDVPGLHFGNHVRPAVLRRTDRPSHFAAGIARGLRGRGNRRPLLVGTRRAGRSSC